MERRRGSAGEREAAEAIAWFDQDAEAYARRNRRPLDRLDELLDVLLPGGRLLDVGCGPGVDAHHAAARGFDIVGIDAAPRMIEVARRQFPDLEFSVADVRRLPSSLGVFDGILAAFSLIFIPKRELPAVLRSLARLLRPNGILLVVVQGGAPAEVGSPNLFSVMTLEDLSALFDRAGLEVVRTFRRGPRDDEMPFEKLYAWGKRSPG